MPESISFIHCADLHLDSPISGIAEINPELSAKLQRATFATFDAIIHLAISRKVDFVVIAGDVFDSAARSLRAQLKFSDGLRALAEVGIHAYIAQGNHDPADSWTRAVSFPDNAHFFGAETVDILPHLKNGVCVAKIYGISYARQNTTENLALKFKREDDLPAIGVLHCNIGDNTGHTSYAPASIEDLVRGNMDYWALGHVHGHAILRPDHPAIVYSGNSQGRHPKETGARGCYCVSMDDSRAVSLEFCPIDTIRFHSLKIDISECHTLSDIIETTAGACLDLAAGQDERDAVVRAIFTGRTGLKAPLSKESVAHDLLGSLRDRLSGSDPMVWVESIGNEAQGIHDLAALRRERNIIGEIIAMHDTLDEADIDRIISPVVDGWSGARYIGSLSAEEKSLLAEEALYRILDAFSQDGEA